MRLVVFVSLATAAMTSGCSRTEHGPRLAGGREVSSWVTELNDPKPRVRRQAVLKLGNVGDADHAVPEGLASALHDSDVLVRRDAVHAVVKLKQPSEAIVARLQEMNRADPNATVRDFAKRALAKLGLTE
ncbi:MAG: HEAT repeat domain-containing protein [Isosphaeraceae bacterium]